MGSHYVPQFYLKGFECSSEPGLIWMYDKASRYFRKVPIAAAAQSAGFYHADTERRLSHRVEGPAHRALAKLRRRDLLAAGDREALTTYIAVMVKRVPAHRRMARELMPSAADKVIRQVSAQIDDWAKDRNTDPDLVARRRTEVERTRERFLTEPPPEVIELVESPWPGERTLEAVSSMTWRILVAPEDNPFLTSDNPVFYFKSFGLGGPESEFTLALASDLALLGSRQGQREDLVMLPPRSALVEEVNRRLASCAERFIFCNREMDWVPRLASRQRPRLNRIQW